ncbi:MAG: filamentous hemagglutinin N-terminal domain-containing protein, partial [Bacillota bacterium]
MKQSRKIRRSWLRNIPEWMRCFARSVTRAVARVAKVAEVARAVAVAGVARVVGAAGEKCQNFARSLNSGLRTLDSGLKAHTKEWAAVALAAGLIAAPYSVDLPSATLNSGLRTQNCLAAPEGGTVVGGAATIQQQTDVTTISQTSARAAIDWSSFDIAKNETVNFLQPNADAAMLNRVIGATSSQIFGNVNANGHIYIVNPNGINVGATANINVNGLYLSTANVSPADFVTSGWRLAAGGNVNANIVVAGNINAGSVVVLENAKTAAVSGTIIVPGGNVTINKIDNININGTIDVSASPTQDSGLRTLNSNNGGRIIVLADNTADVSGARLFARGSSATQDSGLGTLYSSSGGFIETSAKNIYGLDQSLINAGSDTGKAGTWLIDPLNFTIGSGSVALSNTYIGAATLATSLGAQSVTITTANSQGAETGDLLVNAAVSYSAANDLTLSAFHNVNISASIVNTGTGDVTLRADNTGIGYVGASTSGGTVNFYNSATIGLLNAATGGYAKIYYNPANYSTPNITYATTNIKGYYGHGAAYMLVNQLGSEADAATVHSLAAISNNSLWDKNYALGKNIDALATTNWNSGLGFVPIGSSFIGKFDGLGNTISNLYINRTAQYVGLFRLVAIQGTVSNLNLNNARITGYQASGRVYVGGVVGSNEYGIISNITVSGGSISGSSDSGEVNVAGVAGYNSSGKISGGTVDIVTIQGSSTSGIVRVGGVAGFTDGTISNVAVSGGIISGSSDSGEVNVAGVAGYNSSGKISGGTVDIVTIQGSSTSGIVRVGGVAGFTDGTISNVAVSGGIISGSSTNGVVYVGGVAGRSGYGTISGSAVNGATISGSSTSGIVQIGDIRGDAQTANNLYATLTSGSASILSSDNFLTTATVALTGTTASVTQLTGAALTLGASNISAGAFTVTATGPVTQSGVITAGTATINAGSYAITLNTSVNKFGTLSLTGGNAQISEYDAIILGANNLTTLGLTATGGAVTQSGILTIGTATINAGANAITLDTASNDYTTFAAIGGAIAVVDTNSLTLGTTTATGAYSVTAGGAISQVSGSALTVSGLSTLTAGTNIDLYTNAGANAFGNTVTY